MPTNDLLWGSDAGLNDDPKALKIQPLITARPVDYYFYYYYYYYYLLTYSMVQSPSWEANWFAASQEIPHISLNPKVHYRNHKRPPPVPILGQANPVHIPTSHLLEIHRNVIHPSTSRSPQWSLSLRFPHQDPIHPLSSPIRATCPAHLILLGLDILGRIIFIWNHNINNQLVATIIIF